MTYKEIQNLFFDGSDKKHLELFKKSVEAGMDFVNGKTRKGKVLQYESAEKIKSWFQDSVPQESISYEKLFEKLSWIGEYSISQSDKRYLSFPDSGNNISAMIGDIYSKFLNQNMIAFDRSAPISTFVEIQLLEWFRELIGYDFKPVSEMITLSEVGGMITTGGHMSNHIAMLTALSHKYPNVKNDGLSSLDVTPKIAYSSKIGHYSHLVASHHLGIGMKNFVDIKSTDEYKTDVDSLREVLLEDRKNKSEIFYVICVAGNCRTCNIDNIRGMYEVCKEFNVWLHVDACHGGSLIFSDKLKKLYLDGLECADSISLDPHKGLFVTYPASAVMFKKRDALVTFSRYYEKEVRDGSAWDLGYLTPFFGSRGHESLKLWSMISTIGKKKLGEILELRFGISKYAYKLIEESNYFVMLNQVDTYRMAFVFFPEKLREIIKFENLNAEESQKIKKLIDYYTHKINQELYEEGELCLDEFKLLDVGNYTKLNLPTEKYYVMSLTVGNPLVQKKELKSILNILFEKCAKYEEELISESKNLYFEIEMRTQNNPSGPAGW